MNSNNKQCCGNVKIKAHITHGMRVETLQYWQQEVASFAIFPFLTQVNL